MGSLGEAFSKVTSEKAQESIGAGVDAALNGITSGLGEASEKVQRPIEKAHRAIGAEFNAELNGGDYELRHGHNPVHSGFDSRSVTDPVFEDRSTPVEISQRVDAPPKAHGDRSAALRAQTAALFNDVSTDVQSGIEIEDL